MARLIGLMLLIIANAILCSCGVHWLTWKWWAIMVCIVGWSVLSNG